MTEHGARGRQDCDLVLERPFAVGLAQLDADPAISRRRRVAVDIGLAGEELVVDDKVDGTIAVEVVIGERVRNKSAWPMSRARSA
jgi:hypothetical protein